MPQLFQKIAKTAFLFLVISFVLSGCQFIPGNKTNENVSLKYWGLWESSSMVSIINDYKKLKPNVTISYEKKPIQQYRETLEAQINSGKGPDIFRFHNTWTPMLKEELATVPSDIVSQSDFKKNFYSTVFFDLRNQNKEFVGIPLEIDGLSLFWNEDVFTAAGITQPPLTWDELLRDAIRLTVRDSAGNIKTAGAALGTASNVDQFSDILGLMILQNGGDPKNPTDQRSADALEFYTHFAKGENRVWDETQPASTVAFAGNNLAMYFGPSWRAIEIKTANPLLKFKIATVPQLPGGRIAWASYWAEGVSSKSPNQDAAFEFLKYLQDDPTLIKLYSESAKTPGRLFGEPYPKITLADKVKSDPYIGAIIQDAPYMRSFPMASRTFDNGLNDQIIKAYEDAVNASLQGTTSQQALETAAKNINTIYTKFQTQSAPKEEQK